MNTINIMQLFGSNLSDYKFKKFKKNRVNDVFFKRMKEDKYEYKEHYVFIDSRNRDRTKFPSPNNYTVQFNNGDDGNIREQFKNIVSIQLVDAIIPDAVASLVPYLTLDIPELRPSYAGTNSHLSNTFGILLPETTGTPFARCKFVSPVLNKYRTPRASLNKLSLKFKNSDGSLYMFGTDTPPPIQPDITLQNQLIFKIITRTSDYKVLEPILT